MPFDVRDINSWLKGMLGVLTARELGQQFVLTPELEALVQGSTAAQYAQAAMDAWEFQNRTGIKELAPYLSPEELSSLQPGQNIDIFNAWGDTCLEFSTAAQDRSVIAFLLLSAWALYQHGYAQNGDRYSENRLGKVKMTLQSYGISID